MTASTPPILPVDRLDAVLFDMDGVVTDTARAHAEAWKRTFDPFLRRRAEAAGGPFRPFDPVEDYRRHVDGKPRCAGVRSFLRARRIDLPEGGPDDPGDRDTVHGLGTCKNEHFLDWLEHHRVHTYPDTLALVRALRDLGVQRAVFASSRNAERVLRSAGALELFDLELDGRDLTELGLPGKPDPALLLEAARRLGVTAARTAVVEDALAGVRAGAAGGFAVVIAIDRRPRGRDHEAAARELEEAGAHVVVRDLGELVVEAKGLRLRNMAALPDAWEERGALAKRFRGRTLVVCLDYDGTLTPIVDDPDAARLAEDTRRTLRMLARRYPTAVISGRDLRDLRARVQVEEAILAGSHGFEIAAPGSAAPAVRKGSEFLPELDAAEGALRRRLAAVPGHRLERKTFDISVHYRGVAEAEVPQVERAVDRVLADCPRLRKSHGKRVFQLQPRVDWDKGRALRWILEHQPDADAMAVYLGDDITDEDAFRAVAADGLGIVVQDGPRLTAAHYRLRDAAVRRWLQWLAQLPEARP